MVGRATEPGAGIPHAGSVQGASDNRCSYDDGGFAIGFNLLVIQNLRGDIPVHLLNALLKAL